MKDGIKSLVWAIVEISLVFWACNGGPVGAANVVTFLSVANLVSFFILLMIWEEAKATLENRPEWVRSILNWIDLGNLGLLAFAGWWWTLAGYTMGVFASMAYRRRHEITKKNSP